MESEHKLRVMLDTTVLVAGSGWPRWPREVLLAGLRGEIQLVLSSYVIDQADRILSSRFPQFLRRFQEFMVEVSLEIVPDPSQAELSLHTGLVRDETDLPIVLAAINARVDFLISEDKDLTASDATTEALQERLSVLLPGTFLRQVLGWSSERLEELRGRTWEDLETAS